MLRAPTGREDSNPYSRRPARAARACALVAVAVGGLAVWSGVASAAIVVPGTSDPWLAGMPPGSSASLGDTVPNQSPAPHPGGVPVAPGTYLEFSGVTGAVNNYLAPPPAGWTCEGIGPLAHVTGTNYGQTIVPPGTFAEVASGYQHACAVRTDGTIRCWGSNTYGQATPP